MRNEEHLHRKDEDLHHRRGLSPAWSHSRRNERNVGERLKNGIEGNPLLIGIEGHFCITEIERNPLLTGIEGNLLPMEKGQFPPPPPTRDIEWKNYHHIGRSLGGWSFSVQCFTTLETLLHLKPLVLMLWVRPCNRYHNPHFRKKLKERIYHTDSLHRPSSYMMVSLTLWNMSTITIKAWHSTPKMRPWCVRYSLPAWGPLR